MRTLDLDSSGPNFCLYWKIANYGVLVDRIDGVIDGERILSIRVALLFACLLAESAILSTLR